MTADTIGGIWTYALDLINGLDPNQFHVALATMGEPLTSTQWQAAIEQPHLSIYESTYQLEWMDDPWRDVEKAGRWLQQLAQRIEPDIIHLNGYVHAALPWRAPVLVVGHSCVASWWRAVKGESAPHRYRYYRERVQAALRAADMVVTPTRAMLEALVTEYGPLAPTQVIPNGRNPAAFEPAARKEAFVFSIGRLWDEAKNVAALDRVAADLPWPILLAGCNDHPSGHNHALHDAQPLGVMPPDEVAAYLKRAAIYALPARYEPFGLSVLEAALSACALVLGDIPSLRENWEGAALFVPPDDERALHQALQRLIDDAQLRTTLGAAARQRAARFDLATMAGAYKHLYAQLQPQPLLEPLSLRPEAVR